MLPLLGTLGLLLPSPGSSATCDSCETNDAAEASCGAALRWFARCGSGGLMDAVDMARARCMMTSTPLAELGSRASPPTRKKRTS